MLVTAACIFWSALSECARGRLCCLQVSNCQAGDQRRLNQAVSVLRSNLSASLFAGDAWQHLKTFIGILKAISTAMAEMVKNTEQQDDPVVWTFRQLAKELQAKHCLFNGGMTQHRNAVGFESGHHRNAVEGLCVWSPRNADAML